MKKLHVLSAVLVAGFLTVGCSQKDDLQVQDDLATLKSASLTGKYIVVLKEDVGISKADLQARKSKVQVKASGLLKKYEVSGEIEEVYETALQGFAVKMAPGQVKKMEMDPSVGYIEPDQVIALSPIEMNGKPVGGGSTQPLEKIPWGIDRVGGETYFGTNVVWVVDTGVDLTHPDLNLGNSNLGISFVSRVKSPNDDNGHGSHVAGIIAAYDNTIGVVGVAAGAVVVPVKVLDSRGSGYNSWVIAGVNYVAANCHAGDVANMSLGGGVSDALDAAVLAASGKCKFSLAAGNENDNANNHSPARVNGLNIFTISAMGTGDKWASYSNYGNPPVDYCAPGSTIYSTYKNGGYATLSGTSMAAPHVAGLLLLGDITTSGTVIGDPMAPADPIAHR